MRIYISADIEGVCGITHWDEATKSSPDYAAFQQQMQREVIAACEGAIAAALDKEANGRSQKLELARTARQPSRAPPCRRRRSLPRMRPLASAGVRRCIAYSMIVAAEHGQGHPRSPYWQMPAAFTHFVAKFTSVPGLGGGAGGLSQFWQCQDFGSA